MSPHAVLMVVQKVLMLLVLADTARSAPCPAPLFTTLDSECSLAGQPRPCDAPQEPGTRATFKCKALHHFLFDYLPPAGYESECREDGQWSVLPFTCVPVCGQPTTKPLQVYQDGGVSSATQYPWHVAVHDKASALEQVCGGTLVTPRYFVSAAHCFIQKDALRSPSDFKAAVGKARSEWMSSENVNEQTADLRFIHLSDYGGRKFLFANDIALVELETEFAVNAHALPVCVDWKQDVPALKKGQLGTMVGFNKAKTATNNSLKYGIFSVESRDGCKKNVSEALALITQLPDKFCVSLKDGAGVSDGDSGGGLAVQSEEESGAWFLQGILSLSLPKQRYSFYTNVTTFIPWMASIIQSGESSKERCGFDVDKTDVSEGAQLETNDFPWEVEVFHKLRLTHNFTRLWSGTLVKPSLVITAVSTRSMRSISLAEVPPTRLRVVSSRNTDSLDLTQAAFVAKVRRVHYPEDRRLRSGRSAPLFALLELQTPLGLMPVCVDWLGNTLLRRRQLGTAIVERPANGSSSESSRSWRQYHIQSSKECRVKTFVDKYNICVEGQERFEDPGSLSRSLLVSVGKLWFVRGVLSELQKDGQNFTAVYADFGSKVVQQWLSKISDVVGKPTCGRLDICERLQPGDRLLGHMPWNVGVLIRGYNTNRTRVMGGVVVQSNVVLTDKNLFPDLTHSIDGTWSIGALGPNYVKVIWTASNGTTHTTNVSSIRLRYASDSLIGDLPFGLVLLQLATDVDVMPVCLDLSGRVLQPMEPGQMGVVLTDSFGHQVEAWSGNWTRSAHTLTGSTYVSYQECVQYGARADKVWAGDKFCAGPVPDLVESGAALVENAGTYWYLRGISSGMHGRKATHVFELTNVLEETLRDWLSSTLTHLQRAGAPKMEYTEALDCLGVTSSTNECGRFSPNWDGQSQEDDVPMPWSADVLVDDGDEGWKTQAGTLVRSDMVLTDGHLLLNRPSANETEYTQSIPVSDVVVRWISADLRARRSEVKQIHLYKRALEYKEDFARIIALLQLKTRVSVMPACLPLHQAGPLRLPTLSEGQTGLEIHTRDNVQNGKYWCQCACDNILYQDKDDMAHSDSEVVTMPIVRNAFFVEVTSCQHLLPNASDEELAGERFCVGQKENHPLWRGGALFVETREAWYLRGLNELTHGSKEADLPDVVTLFDVQDLNFRDWVRDTMGSIAPAPLRPITTKIPYQCGQWQFQNDTSLAAPRDLIAGVLPWTVRVLQLPGAEGGDVVWRFGTLIRPDVVITDAAKFVNRDIWNFTGSITTVNANRLSVFSVDSNNKRIWSTVEKVHVHERSFGPSLDHAWDVAVLILNTIITQSPACLSLDGYLPAVRTGDQGLVDTTTKLGERPLSTIKDCRAMLSGKEVSRATPDRLCIGMENDTLDTGSGVFTQHSDSWYLRGFQTFSWDGTPLKLGAVVNLEEPSIRQWLRNMLKMT